MVDDPRNTLCLTSTSSHHPKPPLQPNPASSERGWDSRPAIGPYRACSWFCYRIHQPLPVQSSQLAQIPGCSLAAQNTTTPPPPGARPTTGSTFSCHYALTGKASGTAFTLFAVFGLTRRLQAIHKSMPAVTMYSGVKSYLQPLQPCGPRILVLYLPSYRQVHTNINGEPSQPPPIFFIERTYVWHAGR
jgi:hypothetical protein